MPGHLTGCDLIAPLFTVDNHKMLEKKSKLNQTFNENMEFIGYNFYLFSVAKYKEKEN